jgi:hypothetical protein
MPAIFPALVYILCFATSSICAILLGRGYASSRQRLLLYSGICFTLLALNNLVVVFDLVILTDWDFRILRLALALAGTGILLFSFIWDTDE